MTDATDELKLTDYTILITVTYTYSGHSTLNELEKEWFQESEKLQKKSFLLSEVLKRSVLLVSEKEYCDFRTLYFRADVKIRISSTSKRLAKGIVDDIIQTHIIDLNLSQDNKLLDAIKDGDYTTIIATTE